MCNRDNRERGSLGAGPTTSYPARLLRMCGKQKQHQTCIEGWVRLGKAGHALTHLRPMSRPAIRKMTRAVVPVYLWEGCGERMRMGKL